MKTKRTIDEESEKPRRKKVRPHLWTFTDEEEKRMRRAVRAATAFMAKFGQAPQQPLIDTSHYINEHPIKWYGRDEY